MTEPLACAIMLVNGREPMVKRAIASFQSQTYPNRIMLLWDNGGDADEIYIDGLVKADPRIIWWEGKRKTIGAMRNDAIAWALSGPSPLPEIFITMDSDDISHERRFEEQVALLVASKAEAVGYRESLFWDSRKCMIRVDPSKPGPDGRGVLGTVESVGEAWIYRSPDTTYAIGASLAFWRRTWERVPFPDLPKPGSNHSEDWHFTKRVKTLGVSGIGEDGEPRLICSVHGQNSANYSWLGKNKRLRAAQFDEYCRQRMELK